MTAGDEDDGGDADSSSWAEYCSLSDRMVTPDSAMGFGGSSDAMLQAGNIDCSANVVDGKPSVRTPGAPKMHVANGPGGAGRG